MAKRYPTPEKWFPKHPEKYRGDAHAIVVRSSWEKRFLNWCDMNSAVIEYSSEEIIIPYVCETDNKWHRYFLDAHIKVRSADGSVKVFLIEIKPSVQTRPPKFSGKQTPRYLKEVEAFIKNQSKWKAARAFAKQKGVEFTIITEKELGIGKK